MQGIFRKENTDKALKYGIYRHLPTYEKIIRNLVSFLIKNYKEAITQKEIYTTEKYLYAKALRSVAIILSCHGADKNAEKAIRGALRENGKLIISISNEDIIHMLEAKKNNEEPSDDLYTMLDNMLMALEK